MAICGLVVEAYEDEKYLGLIICEHRAHFNYVLGRLKDSVRWDTPNVQLFREGVEVKGGGRVILRAMGDPGMLRGLRPTKILLLGTLGEFWYMLQSMGCPVEASA